MARSGEIFGRFCAFELNLSLRSVVACPVILEKIRRTLRVES